MLSNKQVTSFQLLWKNRFGEEISKEEACEKGIKLVNLIKTICSPDNKQNQKENN
ncbi:MAG: hypothetical protein KAQ87_00145 [Candidatus Pacebacteria bacterium]|nr:hypothetical protein [Candidatus Paceibacterota bacterium]